MGWSGGTEIFDCVASNLILIKHCDNHTVIDWQPIKLLLTELCRTLEDQDWDTLNESNYWTHPVIGKILGNTFEGGAMSKVYARETFDGILVTNQIKGYPRHYLQLKAACKMIGALFDQPRKSEVVVEYELVPTGRKFNMKGELIE